MLVQLNAGLLVLLVVLTRVMLIVREVLCLIIDSSYLMHIFRMLTVDNNIE